MLDILKKQYFNLSKLSTIGSFTKSECKDTLMSQIEKKKNTFFDKKNTRTIIRVKIDSEFKCK
jgi:hypothetical protein